MSEPKRIFLTGAAGHLGSHVLDLLAQRGYAVWALDVVGPKRDIPPGCTFLQADLAKPDDYRDAPAACDAIVHTASIHPWKPYTDAQYIDANVKGTWCLYSLAAELGVGKVVLTSSISATGYIGITPADWPLTEDRVFPGASIYDFTKRVQEVLAEDFAAQGKVRTLALRPPPFMPKSELETGFGLTGPFSVASDMAAAHLAALEVLLGDRPAGGEMAAFEAFFTTNALPYTSADADKIGPDGDMRELIRAHWPEAADWLIEQGYTRSGLPAVYCLDKARRLLGWEPKFNFADWYAQHGPN